MTDPYPIRQSGESELPEFYAVLEHAFGSSWPSEPGRRHAATLLEFDRSLAATDGTRIVGTACAYTFQLTVPGAMIPAAGVSLVGVLPSHRRRGILSSLMRRQLADIRDRGEAIAALYASETGIYGRYGYGIASSSLGFTIRRGEAVLLPGETALPPGETAPPPGETAPPPGETAPRPGETALRPGETALRPAGSAGPVRLRLAEPVWPTAELAQVYDAVLPGRPGMLARDDRWWRSAVRDPEYSRDGAGPLRCLIAEDEAGPRGYALYSVKPAWGPDSLPAGNLSVRELLAADPAAYAAIWSDLLTRDLISEVRAGGRPVDDPLLFLLADRRRARPQLTDELWIRLADVPAALAGRRYACEVDVVIEVTDGLLAENSGRWRLRAGRPGEPAPATCERTAAAADVALPVQALGAAYLGGTRLGALAGAGQVAELTPGALAALSVALSWEPAPWCPVSF